MLSSNYSHTAIHAVEKKIIANMQQVSHATIQHMLHVACHTMVKEFKKSLNLLPLLSYVKNLQMQMRSCESIHNANSSSFTCQDQIALS